MVVTQVYRIPHVPPPPGGPDDLGPSLLTAAGLGLLFVPLSLVMLNHVRDEDSGAGPQSAQHRPAGRWRDRASCSGHRRVGSGRQQRPRGQAARPGMSPSRSPHVPRRDAPIK